MLRISVKDCEHRSQPDVGGNNDRQHRIRPLNKSTIQPTLNSDSFNSGPQQVISVYTVGLFGALSKQQ